MGVWTEWQICTSLKALESGRLWKNKRMREEQLCISRSQQVHNCSAASLLILIIKWCGTWLVNREFGVMLCCPHFISISIICTTMGWRGGFKVVKITRHSWENVWKTHTGIWSKLGKRKHYSCSNMLKKRNSWINASAQLASKSVQSMFCTRSTRLARQAWKIAKTCLCVIPTF